MVPNNEFLYCHTSRNLFDTALRQGQKAASCLFSIRLVLISRYYREARGRNGFGVSQDPDRQGS
jgi:hypothetical protein